MFRRSLLEISTRRLSSKNSTHITTQVPSYLSTRKKYSSVPQGPGSAGEPPESGTSFPKIVLGGVALGGAVFGAYYLNQQWDAQHKVNESADDGPKDPLESSTLYKELQEDENSGPSNAIPSSQGSDPYKVDIPVQEETGTPPVLNKEEESQFPMKDETEQTHKEDSLPVEGKEVSSSTESSITFDDQSTNSINSVEERGDLKSLESESSIEHHDEIESALKEALASTTPEESQLNLPSKQQTIAEVAVDPLPIDDEPSRSLLDEYSITNAPELAIPTLSDKHEDVIDRKENSKDDRGTKDGMIVLDLLEAIHAAEKKQAELDARTLAEEKRKLKEKYEKELKDARAREVFYAQEAALLDKELNKEKLRAAAALKSLREELEKKREMEIELKEAEADIELKKVEELGKAELAAAMASEKASHIEKLAEADQNINALCMAFYARSEEARQSHSVHKLALGALALEDALSKGLPIRKEIDALNIDLAGAKKDPLLDLVLSLLPEETWDKGSDTTLQLRSELCQYLDLAGGCGACVHFFPLMFNNMYLASKLFDALKGSLRHFSLIPSGGGGLLAHSLARVASSLKVRETDTSGDGIESLMNKVESFLAEGKLSEAADTLENGVKGTQAAQITGDWLKRARNRAITEQALTVIQAYAISIGAI